QEEGAPHRAGVVVARSPHVVCREGYDPFQVVAAWRGVGAGDQGPGGTVPVSGEGAGYSTVYITCIAHSPYIVGGNGADLGQVVVISPDVGAGVPGPACAVPVQDQGLTHAVVGCPAHNPHIRGGEGRGAEQVVVAIAEVRAGDHSPPQPAIRGRCACTCGCIACGRIG